MVAISFSFCLSQKLWEEEEMKPLSVGKQDNKFYGWFYVHSVTGVENLNGNVSFCQLGHSWGVEICVEDDNNQKQKCCWVFMTVKFLQQKIKNYASSAYVSRRGRKPLRLKILGVKRLSGIKILIVRTDVPSDVQKFASGTGQNRTCDVVRRRNRANQKISSQYF